MNKDIEQKADELLAALGYELGESRAAYMEQLMQEEGEEECMKVQ